ncbi:hypothetical protein CMZ82_12140 [Lysobacteraceae bacterium NML93-0792]|nr:hypothetical protein CMZ82_12140 [Xanthomonadaceae bacterium NML93-0792]
MRAPRKRDVGHTRRLITRDKELNSMNRIYRKVWNKALGQLVVASEFASGDSVGAGAGGAARPSPLRRRVRDARR